MPTIFTQKDLEFTSVVDFLRIKYDIYMPKDLDSIKAVIQIAHGMVEHKSRYEWLCENLAQNGYVVAISDHRGHGKSIDDSHPLGQMRSLAKIKPLDTPTNLNTQSGFYHAIMDMNELSKIIKNEFSNKKFILLGHSMGSLLSRGYAKLFSNELDALILSGSPAYNALLPFGITLAKILNALGLASGNTLINALSFGGFNKPFIKPNAKGESYGDFAWLNRSQDGVNAYKNDPLCQFVFSLSSFIDLFEGTQWVQDPTPTPLDSKSATKTNFPIYIISGDSDSCGNFGKGVQAIAHNYTNCGFSVDMRLYEEARHEIFQEINKQEVLQELLAWLKKQGF